MWESKEIKLLEKLIKLVNRIIIFYEPRLGKGELNMLSVKAGQSEIVFSFTELDQNGKPIAPLGPIQFTSSNPAVAIVDSTQQTTDPATLVTTVPVVAVAANPDGTNGTADISGVDPATVNKVTAKDTLSVSAVVQVPIATSATGVLSLALTPVSNAAKNPLALG